jgi:Ankyrin repeats (many copies)
LHSESVTNSPCTQLLFVKVFHFEPVLPLNAPNELINPAFPPYIIPDSAWEVEWRSTNPDGWELFKAPWLLADRGDLQTLQLIAAVDPARLSKSDDNGWQPLFFACLRGHIDLATFLVEHGVDVNAVSNDPDMLTPLAVANAKWGEGSAISQYLRGHGAVLDPQRRNDGIEFNRTEL